MTSPSVTTVSHHHSIVIIRHHWRSLNRIHQPCHPVFISIHQHSYSLLITKYPRHSSVDLSFGLDEITLCTDSSPMDYIWLHHNWVLEFIALMLNLLVWYLYIYIYAQIHSRSFRINISHEIIPTYSISTHTISKSQNSCPSWSTPQHPQSLLLGPSNLISHKRWGRHRMPKCPKSGFQ